MNRPGRALLLPMLLVALALAAGCTNRNTWKPTVDPYTDPNLERLGIDEAQCRQIAIEAAGGKASGAARSGVMSALLGAATGAAMGAIWGDAAEGAAAGAIAGAAGGSVSGGMSSDAHFKQVFSNCMRGRGHHVLD